VNSTVSDNCADVLLRIYALTHSLLVMKIAVPYLVAVV